MSTIALTTITDAIHDWIVAGSGLAADHILWSEQVDARGLTPPSGLWIAARLSGIRSVGTDSRTIETNPDPSGDGGDEILSTLRGLASITLSLRAFGGDIGEATVVLADVYKARALESVRSVLRTAKIGVGPSSGATGRDGYVGAAKVFEPRAELNAMIYVPSDLVETLTYIEHVNVTNEITDQEFTVDAPALP